MKLFFKKTKGTLICLILFALIYASCFVTWNLKSKKEDVEVKEKLVLVELLKYYEELLREKGVTFKAIEEARQNKSGKIFNVFHRESVKTRISLPNHFRPGVVVDWWSDFCFRRVFHDRIWHPLFPAIPWESEVVMETADKNRIVGNRYRRIYGYLFVEDNGIYDFKLSSRDGGKLMILDTGATIHDSVKLLENYDSYIEVTTIELKESLMNEQDRKINLEEMFSITKSNIHFRKDQLYFSEIVQGGKEFCKYSLQWRSILGQGKFVTLKDNIVHTKMILDNKPISFIKKAHALKPKYPVEVDENARVSFHDVQRLESDVLIAQTKMQCKPFPKVYRKIKKQFEGYLKYTENFKVYPPEQFNLLKTPVKHVYLEKEDAIRAAGMVFETLNKAHSGKLEMVKLVHIQRNANKTYDKFLDIARSFYFVEMDVKFNDKSTLYRATHFVQENTSGGVCFMEDLKWNPNVKINLLTPIRNQRVWLIYLLQMLEELVEAVKENNIHLILIDFNSNDGDYKQILQSTKLKYTYLNPVKSEKWSEKFNKVKALNYGIRHVEDGNSIVFVLDLHLQLPLNIFDRIRKLTIKGRSSFSPTLLKQHCGEHEQYVPLSKKTMWLDVGTGMIAMYKSDWDAVEGYNEKKFGEKWGGEDWEVIDRIVSKGLFLVHQRMPRFYHIYHNRKGTWSFKKNA